MNALRCMNAMALVALSGCCSAAASGAVRSDQSQPTITTNNGGAVGTVTSFPPPTTSPPPPPVQSMYLWCANPDGPACRTVATTLGAEVVRTEGMPELIFRTMDDQPNDCDSAGMSDLTARLGAALGLPPDRWHDHGGAQLPREHIGDIFYAAGCLNCCNPALAAVKLSAAVGPPRTLLVRVWEIGMIR